MAKLIVRRLQVGRLVEGFPGWPIWIDGRCVASVDSGKQVGIEMAPGRHRVWVGRTLRSPSHEIEAGSETTHHLAVRQDYHHHARIFGLCLMLTMLLNMGFHWWFLSRGLQASLAAYESGLSLVSIPVTLLPLFLQVPFLFFLRNHYLDLRVIPDPSVSDAQIAEFLRANPPRLRIAIRQMMILVAIAAIYLGVAIQWARWQRGDYFRSVASRHAMQEEWARRDRRDDLASVLNLERASARLDPDQMGKTGVLYRQSLAKYRQDAAKAAAKADYHAAMKRKYENAVARRLLSVEPDPPEPQWP
jgi:hypothetical protein